MTNIEEKVIDRIYFYFPYISKENINNIINSKTDTVITNLLLYIIENRTDIDKIKKAYLLSQIYEKLKSVFVHETFCQRSNELEIAKTVIEQCNNFIDNDILDYVFKKK